MIPEDGLFKSSWDHTWFYYRKDGWWYAWTYDDEWEKTHKMMGSSKVLPATKLEFLLLTGHEFKIPEKKR